MPLSQPTQPSQRVNYLVTDLSGFIWKEEGVLGVRMHRAEAGICAHESLFHPTLYDVEVVLHLRFSSFCKSKVVICWG
jgi:hypothetical protein